MAIHNLLNLDLKLETPLLNFSIPQISSFLFPVPLLNTPLIDLPNSISNSWAFKSKLLSNQLNNDWDNTKLKLNELLSNPKLGGSITSTGINVATDFLGNLVQGLFGDSDVGKAVGTAFGSTISTVGNRIANNLVRGESLTQGLVLDVGGAVSGSAAGLAGNLIGNGITSLGGNSMLSRGLGASTSTAIGGVGGTVLNNLFKGKALFSGFRPTYDAAQAVKAAKATGEAAKNIGNAAKFASKANLIGLAGNVAGSGLQAAFGSSKEYGGKYGHITQGMDTAYDLIQAGVGFAGPVGSIISGGMALNKGLSNIFGSTSGMTKTDAILGSAFMPAPVKWLNMAGASTTGTFNNQSWLNTQRTTDFMLNAYGNLGDRFNAAREEAGKTYGTFSQGAKNAALDNLDFANQAWNKILELTNLNEYQNIRSLDMTSINNQRYAQMIQGGFNPIARGKQGMKIFNNATNHNIGMRLLSAAALIDNKQMILSAQDGTKVVRPRMKPHRKGELPVYTEEEKQLLAEWDAHLEEVRKQQKEAIERRNETNTRHALHYSNLATGIAETVQQNAQFEPVTQESLQNSNTEQLRQELLADKNEYFDNGMKFIEAAGLADLGINVAAPLLLRGFRWAFNKVGLLVKVPINKFTIAKSIYNEGNMTPVEVLQATGKGISDVYKTYSPGGAWYQRLLANGVPKEEVDRLASEYLKNLRKTTFEITDSPLSDAIAVTGGEIRNGEMIPKITMDPRYAPNALLVRSAASHEGGHASTLNLEPKNSPYREPEHEGFYLLVEKENPEITKAMEYNESLRPNIKDSALDEVLLDETGSAERHINNVISSQEIRQRALASEIDASNKGVTMDEYINNPNLWDLNFKLLMEIFEESGIKNYMKNYKSIGLKGYPYYYDPITKQWDFSTVSLDVKQGIKNLEEWMNNPVYRKAAEANKEEAEAMGLTYIPYYERPEYIRALENPNIKFKNLDSSVGGESNLSGEVTINTGTTLNPTLVVRHEMGHVAGLGKISEAAAVNPDNTLLLKELKYLRHKSNQVYKEGSEYAGQVDLNRNSFEGIQNARDFGEELGIKIGQEYPGYEKALEIVNSYPENGFKAGLKKMFRLDKEHMPYVWKALAGTLFTLAATLYNTNK